MMMFSTDSSLRMSLPRLPAQHRTVEVHELDEEGLVQAHAQAQGTDLHRICPRPQGDAERVAGDDVDHQEEDGYHDRDHRYGKPEPLGGVGQHFYTLSRPPGTSSRGLEREREGAHCEAMGRVRVCSAVACSALTRRPPLR